MTTQKVRKQLERAVLLEQFEVPLLVITYDGILQVDAVTAIGKFDIAMDIAGASDTVTIGKKQCLLAMTGASFPKVKPLITRRGSVVSLGLTAKNQLWKREAVRRLPMKSEVQVTLRNGLVMTGKFIAVDRFSGLLEVGDTPCLLWKHGIHEIRQRRMENGAR